jgi:hypothetical protein
MPNTFSHHTARVRKLQRCGYCTKGEHQKCVSIYCGCGRCPQFVEAKEQKR